MDNQPSRSEAFHSQMRKDVEHMKQARLFQNLRWRLFCNTILIQLQENWMRLLTLGLASILIWAAIYVVTNTAFHAIRENLIQLGGPIVGTLLDLLFLALGILLIFSTGIILFSSLFTSAESGFLLSTPARADQVFAYKFQGSLAFSSWAFVLLGSPVLVSYGLEFGAPWHYFLFLVLFFFGFLLLPGSIGALLCLLVVNFLPRRPRQIVILAILLLAAFLCVWMYQVAPKHWLDLMRPEFGQRLLENLAATRGPLAPNHWMSRGLQAAVRGDLNQTIYSLSLIWSNGLFMYLVAAWVSRRLYRRGFNRVATGAMLRRRYGGHWLDALLSSMVAFLDRQTRLLIIKDFRTFRRDPAQWAQVVIFLILAGLYFFYVRQFYGDNIPWQYKNVVSLVNLAATALLLCAYTGRFIFPMLSLEGRKFWILGLLPFRRDRLVIGKFAFSAIWSVLLGESIMVFSDLMLGINPWIVANHVFTVIVVGLGLSGLSVGLGTWMPNFRESDPSKIAVGLGGTMNLVVCLLFLIVVISLMAAPWHFLAVLEDGRFELPVRTKYFLVLGVLGGFAVGFLAVIFPLRLGARALRKMEF